MVQRVQSARWDAPVHRGYLERESKDRRGNLDSRGSPAPEVLQDKVCRETRGTEGSEGRKAKRETEETPESQEPSDLWAEWARRENLGLQGMKSSKS